MTERPARRPGFARSPRVVTHRPSPPGWPAGFRLRLLVIADLHACRPWMDGPRIRAIAAAAAALTPDLVLLLGDYVADHPFRTGSVPHREWAEALAAIPAALPTHAVLGNHDWRDDRAAQRRGAGPVAAGAALEAAGIAVLENRAVRLAFGGRGFWLAGLGDQRALPAPRPKGARPVPFRRWRGVDDLPATLAAIADEAPAILLAHEPDIFPQVPARIALTLSGHTHGGQIRPFGRALVVPSDHGTRYAWGHIVEGGRHLVVSGGLGCSGLPLRFGMPPELTLVELGA